MYFNAQFFSRLYVYPGSPPGIKHGPSFLRERAGSNQLSPPALPGRHPSSVEEAPPALPGRNLPPRPSKSGSTASDRSVPYVPQGG